jgi:Tol biopolymer transport system component
MASRLGLLTASFVLLASFFVACGGDEEPRASSPAPTVENSTHVGGNAPTATEGASPEPSAEPTPTQTVPPTATVPLTPTAMADAPIGESGNSEIYVMNADGTEQRRLTNAPAMDVSPAWSPDGSLLAYLSYEGFEGGVLYVMNADGSNQRRLMAGVASRPVWSSDGRQIAIGAIDNEVQFQQIHVVAVDGSGTSRLTSHENVPTTSLSTGNIDPVWSPDGTQIAFIATQLDGPSEVYIMNADGTNVRRLTDSPIRKTHPVWSPDGTQIAYGTDEGDVDIWVMRADGSEQRNLTSSPLVEITPSWSPDSQTIAFVRQTETGDNQIVLTNADGSDPRVVADELLYVEQLVWSADGSTILFSMFHEQASVGIFVMDSDGSGLRQLTDSATHDGEPSWSPDGTEIVFSSKRDGGQPVMCSWSSVDDLIAVESIEGLAWMSRLVVAGTIVEELGAAFGGPGHRDMDGARSIYTDYLLKVEQQYRGEPVEQVRLRVSGGTIGDCVQTVDPTVTLAQGMRVLLFLFEEHVDGDLVPAYFVSPIGAWTVSEDGTISSAGQGYNPAGVDGMSVEEVGALVTETLAGPPSPDAHWVVPIDESPATPQ